MSNKIDGALLFIFFWQAEKTRVYPELGARFLRDTHVQLIPKRGQSAKQRCLFGNFIWCMEGGWLDFCCAKGTVKRRGAELKPPKPVTCIAFSRV